MEGHPHHQFTNIVRGRVKAGVVVSEAFAKKLAEIIVRCCQERPKVHRAIQFLVHLVLELGRLRRQTQRPAKPVNERAEITPATHVPTDEPRPLVEHPGHLGIGRAKVDGRDGFVKQAARLQGAQEVAPAVGNVGMQGVNLLDVGQGPALEGPGRLRVAQLGQAALCEHEVIDSTDGGRSRLEGGTHTLFSVEWVKGIGFRR
jgi:hypothetical protein